MDKINYKLFVPRNDNNYVRFDNEKEFKIDDIVAIGIYPLDDKVIYWFYIRIDNDDEHHKILLKRGKKPKLILLIGNNPYEIIGEAEVENVSYHKNEPKIEITISFTIVNASGIVDNKRKEVKYERAELIDIRED